MLKKLKHRLTGITMMLISVTMIITFLTLIVASSNRMVQESVKYLQGGYTWLAPNGIIDSGATPGHLDDNHIPAELINNKDMPFDGQSPFSTFYVTVDSNGDIISVADFSHHLSEEIITQALPDALAQGKDVGVIKNLNLNFAHFESENNVSTYGFIDVSYQRSMLRKQAIHYSLIGIGCLLVFFLISLFLSGLAIRPVEKAWRQQQQFVADASHELKTPITVMLANTSILLNDKTYDKKTAGKWISYIDIEAKRMKKLVEDLLFLARLDNKESPYQLTKVSISDIVSENTLPFEAILFETGKNLNTDIQPNLYVNADADQLAHLVTILLDNANKYAGNHLPVTVRLKSDRNMAVLSVTNFGEPISKENLPHVFNRFFRGDKARGRSQSSSGLGLSIAKQIVDSYHGKISVRSDATNGTTFTVLLPLC